MGSFKDKHVVSSFSSASCFLLALLNFGFLYFYGIPRSWEADNSHLYDQSMLIEGPLIQKATPHIDTEVNRHFSGPAVPPDIVFPVDYVDDCSEGSIWCCSQLTIHKKSYFGFPNLDDKIKWLHSCRIAASGQQVLLPKILLEHTSPYDFIDGDISFINLHKQIDEFLDPNEGFISRMNTTRERGRGAVPISYGQFYEKAVSTQREHMNRVPILMSAFLQYSGVRRDYLRGQDRGYKGLSLTQILHHWEKQEAAINPEERFILVSILNENWGFLSSTFPNRTASWGKVDTKKFPTLLKFLDDPRLVMLVVNQHSNISHPKIITLPR